MTFNAADWSIAANKDIRYIGDAHGGASPSYCTVLELARALQDFADNATSSGDDLLDITSPNPSERSTDNIVTLLNGYNIDDTAAEHLYDGSISQSDGDVVYYGLVLVGAVEAGTQPQIVQNNAILTSYWGTGLNADATANIIMRLLVKARTGGADIDGRRIRVFARELGDNYGEFSLTLGLGNNTAALFTQADLNNTTAAGTIATWVDIVNTAEGYQTIDLNNGNGPQPYYSEWDRGSRTKNQLYEFGKYIQRRGTATTVYGMNGALFRGITHEWAYDGEVGGPFTQNEVLSWGTGATAGTGALLAINDGGVTGSMWIQLLTGVAPTNDVTVTGGTSLATAAVNGSVTTRTIPSTLIGTSTGSALIGGYGVGIEAADVGASDQLFDLTNTQQSPPNNQTFSVTGLVSTEDRVLVAPNDGTDEIDYDQFTANGAQLAGAATLVVNGAIPADTPATGTVRAFNGTSYDRIPYSSWATSTFTLTGTLPSNVANLANVFISYIDDVASGTSASFSATYAADRSLLVKVRDGGVTPIKPFKTPATFGTGGGTVAAIRTPDV